MNTLSKEDLLKPRYKVITDYPGSVFKVGAVLTLRPMKYPTSTKEWTTVGDNRQLGDRSIYGEIDGYPAIFRKLHWWQDRAANEMPEYVALTKNGYEVLRWSLHTFTDDFLAWNGAEPATCEEYEAACQKEAAQSDPKKEQE